MTPVPSNASPLAEIIYIQKRVNLYIIIVWRDLQVERTFYGPPSIEEEGRCSAATKL